MTIQLSQDELDLVKEALSSLIESRKEEMGWARCANDTELVAVDEDCIRMCEELWSRL